MNEVLYKLCQHCISIMGSWIPYPSTLMAKSLNLSLYKVRKELKSLKEQGLVVADRYCEVTDEGTILINGYTITEKAKQTEEYKKAYEEERKICLDVFGVDIGDPK